MVAFTIINPQKVQLDGIPWKSDSTRSARTRVAAASQSAVDKKEACII